MSKKIQDKKPPIDKSSANKFLRTIPKNEGLELFKAPGEFTGKTATSLSDLADKIKSVDIRAVNYHFKRREFEKWIRNSIGDEELARRFGKLSRELHGEKLRSNLINTIQVRLSELRSVST